MRKMITVLIALVLTLLSGCATLRGMAEDTQNLGRGLKKTIDEQEGKK